MQLDLTEFIPAGFSNQSRVWIYQSSRLFLLSEVFEIEKMLEEFATNWKSHGDPVKGYANLFYGQFIVVMADETNTGVSGCSTDSSVHLIKAMGERFNVNLFERQHLAFLIKDKVQVIPMSQLQYAADNGFINGDTLYFNNTVLTKEALLNNWIIPIKKSWLAARVSLPA